jgi:hypothetical protein
MRIPPRQQRDFLAQERLVSPVPSAVSQAQVKPTRDAVDPLFGIVVPLFQVISGRPLLVRACHFYCGVVEHPFR